jgi:hypothetical protein
MNESNVVQLPDPMHRQWRVFEDMLRQELGAVGADSAVSELALARIKPIYLKHSKPREIPVGASREEQFQAINEWVTQLCGFLLLEVLIREIQLISLRGEGD